MASPPTRSCLRLKLCSLADGHVIWAILEERLVRVALRTCLISLTRPHLVELPRVSGSQARRCGGGHGLQFSNQVGRNLALIVMRNHMAMRLVDDFGFKVFAYQGDDGSIHANVRGGAHTRSASFTRSVRTLK